MEIKEALGNLDMACAEFKGTRTDHVALQQSMQVVTKALEPPKEKIIPKDVTDEKKEPDGNN
ncbi:hypothetical protein LCGC14_1598900 [marine sediment metagenome]|uniref:Uncharacterized protein n=1 Tax=marine sediment metagenome TaxID=412755 RepID=A0A0F9KSI3_9ZZZZ